MKYLLENNHQELLCISAGQYRHASPHYWLLTGSSWELHHHEHNFLPKRKCRQLPLETHNDDKRQLLLLLLKGDY